MVDLYMQSDLSIFLFLRRVLPMQRIEGICMAGKGRMYRWIPSYLNKIDPKTQTSFVYSYIIIGLCALFQLLLSEYKINKLMCFHLNMGH